jgi:hypothetical protein
MRRGSIPSVPRRVQFGLLSAVAAIGVLAALAVSSSQASQTSAKPARLTVGVQVLKMTTLGKGRRRTPGWRSRRRPERAARS